MKRRSFRLAAHRVRKMVGGSKFLEMVDKYVPDIRGRFVVMASHPRHDSLLKLMAARVSAWLP